RFSGPPPDTRAESDSHLPRQGLSLTDHASRTPVSDLLITETVRTIEERQPLSDDAAMQRAFERSQGRQERIVERAKILGKALHLPAELQHWQSLLRYTALALAVLAIVFGSGIAASVTGSDRTLNAP